MASMMISATAAFTSTASSTKNSARSYGDNKGSFKTVLAEKHNDNGNGKRGDK
ncbi:hypothetical protein [Clostridium chromiireducens]|uniref:hypothetical protein n=1 Tax=Clostridium chromiireducens TaxID=225345 RepID=UPI0015F805A3|nr:hypothetical protein [Clostridium chromiireducens]